ncbi:hypothetical protein FSC37_13715 [Piscinibacter aquaticus]|uniref:Transporter n=1 Tax=Piscinibacter aquaticus TaxID=392597 RepID=A0A5C6U0P5_9BURK|nr:hypothetical protein FSC37_13715 [Piscinibacter aquaticus]
MAFFFHGTMAAMTRLFAALTLALLSLAAQAADRPYVFANSGAAEDDEEQVWSVENWYRKAGRQASLTVAPEYAFNPDNSLQAEFRRVVDRDRGNGHELEIEFKHLFNRISRDGWGWGVVAAIDMERPRGGPWERAALSLSVPLTGSSARPTPASCTSTWAWPSRARSGESSPR